jgi:hypothetical protein
MSTENETPSVEVAVVNNNENNNENTNINTDNIHINVEVHVEDNKEKPVLGNPVEEPEESEKPEEKEKTQFDVYFDRLVEDVENLVGDNGLTPLNLLSVCVNLMQTVENLPDLKGSQKKDLVVKVLEKCISGQEGDSVMLAMLPSFIDTTISVDRHEVEISLDTEDVMSCCLGICSAVLATRKKRKKKKN